MWHEYLRMSSSKIQKLMRKTRQSTWRNAEFNVINITPPAEQPAKFHNGDEFNAKQRQHFRSLPYDDDPELL
jgi:hypothetical protein